MIQNTIRDCDIAARYGGEEFAIINFIYILHSGWCQPPLPAGSPAHPDSHRGYRTAARVGHGYQSRQSGLMGGTVYPGNIYRYTGIAGAVLKISHCGFTICLIDVIIINKVTGPVFGGFETTEYCLLGP